MAAANNGYEVLHQGMRKIAKVNPRLIAHLPLSIPYFKGRRNQGYILTMGRNISPVYIYYGEAVYSGYHMMCLGGGAKYKNVETDVRNRHEQTCYVINSARMW